MHYLTVSLRYRTSRGRRWLHAKLKGERKRILSSGHRRCRAAASHGAVLVDGVAGRVRRVRGLPGTGAPEPADEAYAHQFQAPSVANHEELFLDKSESGRQGPQATRAEDRSIEKGAAGTGSTFFIWSIHKESANRY